VQDGSAAAAAALRSGEVPDAEVHPTRPVRASRVDVAAEAEVLAAVRRGQHQVAQQILVDVYSDAITAFAIRVLRNGDAAKDVHQQVFLEAFQGIEKFEGRATLWRWLCGIAFHRCMDVIRRTKRTAAVDDSDVWNTLLAPPDPMMDPARVTQRRALEACLGKLEPELRAQLLLRLLHGLSFVEIGEIVKAAPGTVQVRVSRILPKLRRCLRGEGIER
jgi:RNA polymerase sigma factor (sigma-70 family)